MTGGSRHGRKDTRGDVVPLYSKTLAEIYERQGHLDKAGVIYEKLLEEHPADRDLAGRLERVRRTLGADTGTGIGPGEAGDDDLIELLKELLDRVRRERRHGIY